MIQLVESAHPVRCPNCRAVVAERYPQSGVVVVVHRNRTITFRGDGDVSVECPRCGRPTTAVVVESSTRVLS